MSKRITVRFTSDGIAFVSNHADEDSPPFTDKTTPLLIAEARRRGLEMTPACPLPQFTKQVLCG